MKGAVGSALILNMVITFVLIFFSLLIGSMAYSKAYKTKNFLINLINEMEESGEHDFASKLNDWDTKANDYLTKVGYPINSSKYNTCPYKSGYSIYVMNAKSGKSRYDYCIYRKADIYDALRNKTVKERYNYMVLVYMKFDVPVLGQFIKLPITGETKTYTILR